MQNQAANAAIFHALHKECDPVILYTIWDPGSAKIVTDAGAKAIATGSLCEATPLPVNIIALPHVPDTPTLAGLGVARISCGPVPYRRMAKWLEAEARQALAGD